MSWKYSAVIIALLFITVNIKSQVSYGGLPYTMLINTTNSTLSSYRAINQNVNSVTLPSFDNAALQATADSLSQDTANGHLWGKLYGRAFDLTVNLVNEGTYDVVDNKKIYRYHFHSDNANSLEFYFSKFKLPESGSLYFYNSDKTKFFGAIRNDNNPNDSLGLDTLPVVMSTIPLPGNDWIMEYNEDVNAEFPGEIEVTKMTHVFTSPSSSSGTNRTMDDGNHCQIDVNCILGDEWQVEKKSTVMISRLIQVNNVNNVWAGFGTGNLVNRNVEGNDQGLYVVTAGHLFHDNINNDVSYLWGSIKFIYNYEKDYCYNDGTTEPPNLLYSSQGAIILACAHYVGSYDFALLQLENISAQTLYNWHVCFAGWDKNAVTNAVNAPYVMIHHAEGKEKKISETDDAALESVTYVGDVNTYANAGFFRAKWDQGVGLIGSDGASLFDQNHHIIATYNGLGDAQCVDEEYNDGYDRFSKFSKSFAFGGFSYWLGNGPTVESYCPPEVPEGGEWANESGTSGFVVNGHPFISDAIKVCANNVVLTPLNDHWGFSEENVGKLCANMNNQAYAARLTTTWFGQICHATFLRFFLSIQECDEHQNLIGSEYSQWFYYYDNDQSTFNESTSTGPIDLASYPPQGYTLQDGKYYKIKYACVQNNDWMEYSVYINTISQNLTVQDPNVTADKVAESTLTLINTTVPIVSPQLQFVAGVSIKLSPTSDLKSGRYYISPVNCDNAYTYRSAGNNQPKGNTQTSSIGTGHTPKREKSPERVKTADKSDVTMYPNPTSNNLNVDVFSVAEGRMNLIVESINGQRLINQYLDVSRNSHNQTTLNMEEYKDGMYLVKIIDEKGNLLKVEKVILNR